MKSRNTNRQTNPLHNTDLFEKMVCLFPQLEFVVVAVLSFDSQLFNEINLNAGFTQFTLSQSGKQNLLASLLKQKRIEMSIVLIQKRIAATRSLIINHECLNVHQLKQSALHFAVSESFSKKYMSSVVGRVSFTALRSQLHTWAVSGWLPWEDSIDGNSHINVQ